MKIFCECCEEAVEFIVEPMQKDDLNDAPWGDILCKRCHLVIATLSSDKEGEVFIEVRDKGKG